MKVPFVFGKVAEKGYFTNRKKELKRLISNFENTQNTIIISPRRWGKTSLVKEASRILLNKNKNIKICLIDLFFVRNEQEFYSYFAKEVLKSFSLKISEVTDFLKKAMSRIIPKITVNIGDSMEFEINFDEKDIEASYKDILNLPEKIANKKNKSLVICIDEFQNVSSFHDNISFQKKLRSVWQYHKNVSYCIYGSKKHMLMHLFENTSQPFYKFGDTIYLNKIEKKNLVKFIIDKFTETKKNINNKIAEQIVDLMKCHPYYVQQLSYIVWINTKKTVTQSIFDDAIKDLLQQNTMFYQREVESLSNSQINFLTAISDGIKDNYTSKKVVDKYKLGTSANIIKVIKALDKKEIIDSEYKPIEFIDPAFQLWFQLKQAK